MGKGMVRQTRHGFLFFAFGGASAVVGFAIGRTIPVSSGPVDPSSGLEELLASGAFSPGVGQRFLASGGLSGDAAYRLLMRQVMEAIPNGDVRAEVSKRVAEDFRLGNLCDVDGWQLTITECRLSGLAFLLKQQGFEVASPTLAPGNPIDHLPDWRVAEFGNWGPQSTVVDEPFNVQSNGQSALWFHVDEIDRQPYKIHVGSFVARTVVNAQAKLISASFAPGDVRRMLAREGDLPVHVVDSARGKQFIGRFRVRSRTGEP